MEEIELKGQDINIYKEILENGLEVYLIPYRNRNNYYITYLTRFGSIHTDFKLDNQSKNVPAGIAHFLEHKMFEQKDGIDPFDFFAKTGTECNASTTYKRTRYYISGNKNLEENLEFFINFINSPYYTDENVEKEKGIIIEELRMYRNMPSWKISNELYKATFNSHPVRIDIGGTEESVRSITKESLYDCYNAFYEPSNMVLVIAGNFDKDKIIEIIKNNKVLKERTNVYKIKLKDIKEKEEVKTKQKELTIPNLTTEKLSFSIKSKIKDKYLKNDYRYRSYIAMILNILFGQTSKFKEEMLNKELMTTLNVETMYLDNIMIIEFNSDTKKPEELINSIDEHIRNYKITPEEIKRCQKVWTAASVYATDIVSETASTISSDVAEYQTIIRNRIDEIKRMNLDELEEIRKTINLDNRAVIIAKPQRKQKQQ